MILGAGNNGNAALLAELSFGIDGFVIIALVYMFVAITGLRERVARLEEWIRIHNGSDVRGRRRD